ncbi:MAG: hypothetical protein U0V74_08870 [Chitinophagales bacterium]
MNQSNHSAGTFNMHNVLLLFTLTFLLPYTAPAQCNTPISSEVTQEWDGDLISFKVRTETNIRCYLITGSYDDCTYEIIGIVNSKGNSVMPCNYQYLWHGQQYNYYKVEQLNMMGAVCAHGIPVSIHSLSAGLD